MSFWECTNPGCDRRNEPVEFPDASIKKTAELFKIVNENEAVPPCSACGKNRVKIKGGSPLSLAADGVLGQRQTKLNKPAQKAPDELVEETPHPATQDMDEVAAKVLPPLEEFGNVQPRSLLSSNMVAEFGTSNMDAVECHPMDAYNVQDFRDVMGHKAGPYVALGMKEDYKTLMAQCLAGYHSKTAEEAARRCELEALIKHANGWIDNYGSSSKKEQTDEKILKGNYLCELILSAQQELRNKYLGAPAGSEYWITKRLSQPSMRKLFAFMEEGFSATDEALEVKHELNKDESDRITKDGVWDRFKKVASATGDDLKRHWDDAGHGLHGLVGCVGDILKLLDFLGIGHLIRCASYLSEFAIAYLRREYFDAIQQRTTNIVLKKVALYAMSKLSSKLNSSIFLALMSFGRGLSRLLTLLSGGTTAVVTEAIQFAFTAATIIHESGRNVKGIYKAVIGTKGVARAHHAQALMRQIANNREEISKEAMDVFEGFFRASYWYGKELPGGSFLTMAASAMAGLATPMIAIKTMAWREVVNVFFGDDERRKYTRHIITRFLNIPPTELRELSTMGFANDGQSYDLQSLLLVNTIACNKPLLKRHQLTGLDVRKVQALFLLTFGAFGSRPSGGGWGPIELKVIDWLSVLPNPTIG